MEECGHGDFLDVLMGNIGNVECIAVPGNKLPHI